MSKSLALLCICFGGVQAHTVPDRLLDAIQMVETGGEPDPSRAVGDRGRSFGWLQISDAVIADVNSLYPKPKYTRADAGDYHKSRIIATEYLMMWCNEHRLGRTPTMEDAARIWNGGPYGWRKPSTRRYWAKVQKHL